MDLSPLAQILPEIEARRTFKASRIFTIEELKLKFHNGEERVYERIVGGRGAVMIVPYDGIHFYLTAEYAGGLHQYSLGLVKGKIDEGESGQEAALRELAEEIGLGARRISLLRAPVTVAPGMLELSMHLYLAEDLYPHQLSGDEPEPIQIIKASPAEVKDLIFNPDAPLHEARAAFALTLALHKIGAL